MHFLKSSASMIIILLVVATRGPALDASLRGDPSQRWTIVQPGIPSAIGVISFAFVCHHNSRSWSSTLPYTTLLTLAIVLIYGSLHQPTLDRFARITHVSTSFSVAASLAMALCGFLVFAEKTKGVSLLLHSCAARLISGQNILNNFPADDGWTNIARACFGMNMYA